eukprot:4535362-Amphidinium_carterae.1
MVGMGVEEMSPAQTFALARVLFISLQPTNATIVSLLVWAMSLLGKLFARMVWALLLLYATKTSVLQAKHSTIICITNTIIPPSITSRSKLALD